MCKVTQPTRVVRAARNRSSNVIFKQLKYFAYQLCDEILYWIACATHGQNNHPLTHRKSLDMRTISRCYASAHISSSSQLVSRSLQRRIYFKHMIYEKKRKKQRFFFSRYDLWYGNSVTVDSTILRLVCARCMRQKWYGLEMFYNVLVYIMCFSNGMKCALQPECIPFDDLLHFQANNFAKLWCNRRDADIRESFEHISVVGWVVCPWIGPCYPFRISLSPYFRHFGF